MEINVLHILAGSIACALRFLTLKIVLRNGTTYLMTVIIQIL